MRELYKKYPSYEEAIADLEKKGPMKFWGRLLDYRIFTLTVLGKPRISLYIHDDGLVMYDYS